MENSMNSWRDLRLPAPLCEAMEKQIKGSQFATLEDFLTFVLRELTSRNGAQLDEQERAAIEKRLRDLGYM
jgi:hypothetical protein